MNMLESILLTMFTGTADLLSQETTSKGSLDRSCAKYILIDVCES